MNKQNKKNSWKKKNLIYCHGVEEYFDKCSRCGGEIRFVREGHFGNPVSDITECKCLILEHENSMELMGNTIHFGNSQVVEDKLSKLTKEEK